MSQQTELEAALTKCGLTEKGYDYVINTLESAPDRKVGVKRAGNHVLKIPVRRLSVALQAESWSGEYNFLVEISRRSDVIAIFDQPPAIPLQITNVAGKKTRTTYTADYLVITNEAVIAYEIKSEDKLSELARERVYDWKKYNGKYTYVPAKKYFNQFNIDHIVVSTNELNPVRAANYRLLETTKPYLEVPKYQKQRALIKNIVKSEYAIRFSDVLERINCEDLTPILQLIDSEDIFCDLDNLLLTEPDSIWLSTDHKSALIAQGTETNIFKHLDKTVADNDLKTINPKYIKTVAARLHAIDPIKYYPESVGLKKYTDRQILNIKYILSENNNDLTALIPKWHKCGNRDTRISETHKSLIALHIKSNKQDSNWGSIRNAFNTYLKCFNEIINEQSTSESIVFNTDESPVSLHTFYRYHKSSVHLYEDIMLAGGRKLANQRKDTGNPDNALITATHPFAVAHIDHHKSKIQLVLGKVNGKNIVCRPWISAMIDSYSGVILAFWISFKDPSKATSAMVIRDCVLRHGRLPKIILSDNGADFKSISFMNMILANNSIVARRPPDDGKAGNQIERAFRDFIERFMKGMPGFCLPISKARMISKAFKSDANSKLSLLDLYNAMNHFIENGFNTGLWPDGLCSKIDIHEIMLEKFPTAGSKVEIDTKFMISTAVSPPSNKYKLVDGKGIHILDKWYSSPNLLQYRGYKKDIEVRIEPFNYSIIYVHIEGNWHVCKSTDSNVYSAYSDINNICKSTIHYMMSSVRRSLKNDESYRIAEIQNEALAKIVKSSSEDNEISQKSVQENNNHNTKYINIDDIKNIEEWSF